MESIWENFNLSCREGNQSTQSRDLIGACSTSVLDHEASHSFLVSMKQADSLWRTRVFKRNGKEGKSLHCKNTGVFLKARADCEKGAFF